MEKPAGVRVSVSASGLARRSSVRRGMRGPDMRGRPGQGARAEAKASCGEEKPAGPRLSRGGPAGRKARFYEQDSTSRLHRGRA